MILVFGTSILPKWKSQNKYLSVTKFLVWFCIVNLEHSDITVIVNSS